MVLPVRVVFLVNLDDINSLLGFIFGSFRDRLRLGKQVLIDKLEN
jgi:hypothetical protein